MMRTVIITSAVLIVLQPFLASAQSEDDKKAAKLYGSIIQSYTEQPCDSAWLSEPLHDEGAGVQRGRFECYDESMKSTGHKYDLRFNQAAVGGIPISIKPAN